jgi:quercetin dioxygenase-like cupin family protein
LVHEVQVERPLDHLQNSGAEIFVGRVQTTVISATNEGLDVPGVLVNFLPGAHTKLNKHSADQVLIVVGGRGFIGDPEHPELVQKGDIVRIPAGTPHVHGAGPDSGFNHVALLSGTTEILEDTFQWPPRVIVSGYSNE